MKAKNLVKSFSYYQLTLNYAALKDQKIDKEDVKRIATEFLKKQEGVAFVVDNEDVQNANIPSAFRERIQNGYHRERSGVVQVILEPGWYSGSASGTGASHGTLNPYDTHIPLVFMGWGIKHGKSNNTYHITDIAPTVSGLLHIQEPNGNIGKPITEVYK